MAPSDSMLNRSADRLEQRAEAVDYLADCLQRGELWLLVGSGLTRDLGLPGWETLVDRCEAALHDCATGDPYLVADPEPKKEDLLRRIDRVRRAANANTKCEYLDIVRDALYQEVATGSAFDQELVLNKLLIGIGSMCMSSFRGSVRDVVSLNFDDVLEWYLCVHGFSAQSLPDMPRAVRGDVDVRVFHIHGFVGMLDRSHGSRQGDLVFGRSDYENRIAETHSPWSTMLENLFGTKTMLAIGTSFDDSDVWISAKRALKTDNRPIGFVAGTDLRKAELREEKLFVPLPVCDYEDDLPDLLLEICRRASKIAER